MDRRLARELELHFCNHNDEALRLATRLVGAPDRGEDVVMSVWLRLSALLSRPAAELPPSLAERPRGYLFRAVRNMATDHLLRMRREAEYRVDLEDTEALADDSADAAERLHLRRKIATLAVAINGLSTDCRRAFILCRLHGWPHREIAETLGVSISMVEKHMIRALRQCRDALAEAGY